MCRRAAAPRARPAGDRRSASPRRPTAGASRTSATCASRSLPGALGCGRRGRDGDRVGPRLRRPDPPQRHRLLEVSPREREPVGAELHAVDLPDTVAQRDPQAVPDDTPPCHLVAELGGAVAPDHDVTDLVLRLRLPRALEAGTALTAQTEGEGKQTDDQKPKKRHGEPSRRIVAGSRSQNTYPGSDTRDQVLAPAPPNPTKPPAPPAAPVTSTGACASRITAICGSHLRIICTNVVTISGSNSIPPRPSRYPRVRSWDQASRYGRLVRSASYTSHTCTSLLA